ncbi:MAG: hypothetical protein AMXMBFR84_18070 [Candidatus Hydrogenedentota bacterium]
MRTRATMLLVAVGFSVTLAPWAFAAPGPDDVLGIWYTDGNSARVEVYKDKENKYHGKIVWLKDPLYEEGHKDAGKPKTDQNNPDPEKHNNPIIGLNLVQGFDFDGETWSGGTVYDPENGKTYKCMMTLDGADTLNVRGYLGIPALGRTTVWKRVPKEVLEKEKTDAATQSAAPQEQSAPAK